MADYSLLFGYSNKGCKELRNVEEVADFIVNEGCNSDLIITTPLDLTLITTFGPYINKIYDSDYREELMKVLIPKQQEFEQNIE